MRAVNRAVIVILLILFNSCKSHISDKADLINYINDKENGLTHNLQLSDLSITLNYVPERVLFDAERASKSHNQPNREISYFLLSLSKGGKELMKQLDFNLYSDLTRQFSFGMQQHVYIKTGNGKIFNPIDCIYQKNYGYSSSDDLLILFNTKEILQGKNFDLIIGEFGLNIGEQSFRFQTSKLEKIKGLINY